MLILTWELLFRHFCFKVPIIKVKLSHFFFFLLNEIITLKTTFRTQLVGISSGNSIEDSRKLTQQNTRVIWINYICLLTTRKLIVIICLKLACGGNWIFSNTNIVPLGSCYDCVDPGLHSGLVKLIATNHCKTMWYTMLVATP